MKAYNYKQVPVSGFYFAVNYFAIADVLEDSSWYLVYVDISSGTTMTTPIYQRATVHGYGDLDGGDGLVTTGLHPQDSSEIPEEILIGPISFSEITSYTSLYTEQKRVRPQDIRDAYKALGVDDGLPFED